MKMSYLLSVALLAACQASPNEKTVKHSTESTLIKPPKANTVITLGVKGMVCQMGCGGSIRKGLKQTGAVERVQVEFVKSLEEQKIQVYYDRTKIAPQQLIQILEKLNDKQFSVRELSEPSTL
ncbi:MAG: hypothetical protein RLZZ301_577 [Bacteroidota bacterium]|jgi:copper chaperone CopZ